MDLNHARLPIPPLSHILFTRRLTAGDSYIIPHRFCLVNTFSKNFLGKIVAKKFLHFLKKAIDKLKLSEEEQLNFLFTAGAIGLVIGNNASISGAEGGCQAEVGSASAMSAAALVKAAGGSAFQASQAVAFVIKNMLGLICDPVAGLVEVPCVKRNALGSSFALVAADMALAGIESQIPVDEVVDAMYQVGASLPTAFRETAEGGLAATPTGRRLQAQIFGE